MSTRFIDDDYRLTDYNGQTVTLEEGGVSLFFSVSVDPESVDIIELREEDLGGTTVNAKLGIEEEQTAYLIVTRTIFNGTAEYTINYRLAITVRPQA